MRRLDPVRRSWRTWGLLLGLFAVFVAVSVVGQSRGAFDPVRDHSSTRTNPWGTKAYRDLLERCQVRTETWDRPPDELDETVKLLMLLDPQLPLTSEQSEALLEWVHAGGRLVFAPFGGDMDAPRVGHREEGWRIWAGHSGRLLLASLGLVLVPGGEPEARGRVQEASSLTADVRHVIIPSSFRLEHVPDEQRLRGQLRKLAVGEQELADLKVLKGATLRTDLSCKGEPVVVTIGWGRGRVHVLADVEMLANRQISSGDNVVLAANLVFADGAPERVHFDEYSHFLGCAGCVFGAGRDKVDARPVWWTVWALIAVAAVYALGRGWRFGAPVVKDQRARRPTSDYVRAFADLYSQARAGNAALEMLAAAYRRRLAQAAGLAPFADPLRVAQGLSRKGLPGDDMVQLLSTAQLRSQETIDEAELLRFARAMANYERML